MDSGDSSTGLVGATNEVSYTVFDIEGDGLKPTKIHCMAWMNEGDDGDEPWFTDDYDLMRQMLLDSEVLVGHNIQLFDVPVLERLLDIKIKSKLIDTLALSWYLYPNRTKHGLESWGETFGIQKPEIEDWQNLDLADYVHRCKEDVRINSRLWEKQYRLLNQMYPDGPDKLLEYLEFKMDCAREQERVGWKLDIDKTRTTLAALSKQKEEKTEQLKGIMPPVEVWAEKSRPAKMYKKNGELTVAGKQWIELNGSIPPSEGSGPIRYLKAVKEPNPNSHSQIKDWLFSLGWKPETFKYNRDKQTNELKRIPQIQQDKSKGPGLCPSVKRMFDKHPQLAVLDGLSILTHRISILEGFLENVDSNGFIRAEIGGLTNTLRFKHRVLVNLPSANTGSDIDIRGCLIAPEGYVLAGSDMSSLEDRTKQHYIFKFDPEFVEEMCKPGFDPHMDLAYADGAVTDGDIRLYKETEDRRVKAIRHTYKQGNYAATYGAKPKRIAVTIGCTLPAAEKIYNAYWKRNWAINSVAKEQRVEMFDGSFWLFNPVSKFWYSLRCDKDRFSTLNQGTAVYCFDTYLKHIRNGGPPIIAQFHDEWVALVRLGNEKRLEEHVSKAIKETNEELKLNRELSAELHFGSNYGEIH